MSKIIRKQESDMNYVREFKVGDTISFSLDIRMENEKIKAKAIDTHNGIVTFITKDAIAAPTKMHWNNDGCSGYLSSNLRKTICSTIIDSFPLDIRHRMVPNIKSITGDDLLWIPSVTDIEKIPPKKRIVKKDTIEPYGYWLQESEYDIYGNLIFKIFCDDISREYPCNYARLRLMFCLK